MHTLEPLVGLFDTAIGTMRDLGDGRVVSPAHALIKLWLTAERDVDISELAAAYEVCLLVGLRGFLDSETLDDAAPERYCSFVFYRLAADRHRLPSEWFGDAIRKIAKAAQQNGTLRHLARSFLGECI